MQTISKEYPIRRILENIESGNIVFNHPMQRKPGQWDNEQQSLLIHSILGNYAIPQAYALQIFEGDIDSFSVLDGKQRFTTVHDFANGKFKLSNDTPVVVVKIKKVITDEEGNRKRIKEFEEFDVAGKYYSELDEKLQTLIKDFPFSVIMLSDCTDEEIEDQFFRLNNGTALTKDQKTRVVLGDELSKFIDEQESKDLFQKKSCFTKLQRKSGEVQTCILQTLMLVMDFDFKNFNKDAVMSFAEWFRANHKKSDLEYCSDLFDKLEAAMVSDKPNKLMKKINIPIFAYHVQTVDEIGMPMEKYAEWIQKFSDSYNTEYEYASHCGQASTSKAKVMARLDYVSRHLREV